MMKPINGYVLAIAPDVVEKTASGIYLPDSAKEMPQKAKVHAVPDVVYLDDGKEIPCPLKPGDVIIYKKWGGNEVEVDEGGIKKTTYYFIKFADILATENGK
jgi:chaperonin GroES